MRVYRATTGAGSRANYRRRKLPLLWSLAAVFLGVAIGALVRFGATDQSVLLDPSIAVMPFRAIGGAQDAVEFGEGLTDDVVTALSESVELRVMSAAATAADDAGRTDPRNIGEGLGVRYILDGSVREAEGQVRVTAQLVDVATGFHLWGGRYDRPFSDTLAMQEDLASRIGETLIVKLDEAEQERLAAGGGSGLGEFLWSGLEGLARLANGAVGMTLGVFRWIFGADAAA